MFSSFEEAEAFVQDVIGRTRNGEIKWVATDEGFIQEGWSRLPSFFLFGEDPSTLILRASSENFDVVVDCRANPAHAQSLAQLCAAIKQKNNLLF